jgi:hypothetical protein
MEPKPARVVWIYASEDEPTARELLRLAAQEQPTLWRVAALSWTNHTTEV